MPVKIKLVDNSNDPRVISLEEYETGRANFSANYFLSACNNNFGGQDLEIPWLAFYNAINGFITANQLTASTVALRFVYCYDVTTTDMYLRMQICTMQQSPQAVNIFNLVTTTCAWFTLENGTVTPTTNTSLSDANYLSNFYYCNGAACSPSTAVCLASDVTDTLYAQNVTFPWIAEIFEMYSDNNSPVNATICFGACSYINGGDGNAPILYPHGMVMYLRDQYGNALLDNDDEVVLFHNKGCDMGTMCPTNCNIYILPTNS